MRADNTRHLVEAARTRAEGTRRRAVTALHRMDAAGQPVTFDSVAREAGVSRSWLYAQQDLRRQIQRLRTRRGPQVPTTAPPQRQRASEASLLRRLEAAGERIRALQQDNRQLRDALARALGERRNTEMLHGAMTATRPGNSRQNSPSSGRSEAVDGHVKDTPTTNRPTSRP
jgi:Family of unknown function (DUF6262)